MRSFDQIYQNACRHKGGPEAVEEELPQPKTRRQLSRTGDDRFLSAMAKQVFRSGFVWRVVEQKWPDFERAFHGFDPTLVASMDEHDVHDLMNDEGVIRNLKKLQSVVANARYVEDCADEHGSFAKMVSAWPSTDIVGLWLELKKNGSRLGGNTGPMMLRFTGKDTFILTEDVVKTLVEEQIVDKAPTSIKALRATQEAFNSWSEESGRPLCQISRVLAMSQG